MLPNWLPEDDWPHGYTNEHIQLPDNDPLLPIEAPLSPFTSQTSTQRPTSAQEQSTDQ